MFPTMFFNRHFDDDDTFFRPSSAFFGNRPTLMRSPIFSMEFEPPRTPPSAFFDADKEIRASRERLQQEIASLKRLYADRSKVWQQEQQRQQQQEQVLAKDTDTTKSPSYSISSSEYHSSDINGKHNESSKSLHKAVKPSPNIGYEHYECKNGECFGFRVYVKPNVVRAWDGHEKEGSNIPIGVNVHQQPAAYHKKLRTILEKLSHANKAQISDWAKQANKNVKQKTPSPRKRTRTSSSTSATSSKRTSTRKSSSKQVQTRRRRQ